MGPELGGASSPERWPGLRKQPREPAGYDEALQSPEMTPVFGWTEGFQGMEPYEIRPIPVVDQPSLGIGEYSDEAPDVIGEASGKTSWKDVKVRVGDEAKGAIAEYTVEELDDKILNTLWDLWTTPDGNSFLGAERIIEALDRNVHVVGLRDPSKALLSSADVPDVNIWSSIIQEAPIDSIDKPLGSIERWVEIGGMIAAFASGNMPMAYVCFKAFMHSEVHRMSVEAIEHLIAHDHSASPDSDKSPPSGTETAHHMEQTAEGPSQEATHQAIVSNDTLDRAGDVAEQEFRKFEREATHGRVELSLEDAAPDRGRDRDPYPDISVGGPDI